MARHKVNKRRSSGKFKKQVKKTKSLNVRRPARGGYRI